MPRRAASLRGRFRCCVFYSSSNNEVSSTQRDARKQPVDYVRSNPDLLKGKRPANSCGGGRSLMAAASTMLRHYPLPNWCACGPRCIKRSSVRTCRRLATTGRLRREVKALTPHGARHATKRCFPSRKKRTAQT
eukprot:3487349-Pleurochrysis_carterae.AAC.1